MSEKQKVQYRWPPRVIFNTDLKSLWGYRESRSTEDAVRSLVDVDGTSVDAFTAVAAIAGDGLTWRGSPNGHLWGDNVEDWDPDRDPDRPAVGGMSMQRLEMLYSTLVMLVEDGHELLQLYLEKGRELGKAVLASFRMNDLHTSHEDRSWYSRCRMKIERPDLLIGSPSPRSTNAGVEDWKFSWQWDFRQPEVRKRFLSIFEETLSRYDLDGLELDFCRQPPFFGPFQAHRGRDEMTGFVRETCNLVRRFSEERRRDLRLIVHVPPNTDADFELGLDLETWIREGLADIFVLGSVSVCSPEIDIARAAEWAGESGSLIYTGFDGSTHPASPQEGFEGNPPGVLRAAALNGYRRGASGVRVYNYDWKHHRAGPAESEEYLEEHLRLLEDLGHPEALALRNRCYCVTDAHIGSHLSYALGDPTPQLPRKLAMTSRGAGRRHALTLTVEDDVEKGLSEGRIKRTELRIRLLDHEGCFDRISSRLNGTEIALDPKCTIENSKGDSWIVVENPPVTAGVNRILLLLEGERTPDPWPTVQQCEIDVICE